MEMVLEGQEQTRAAVQRVEVAEQMAAQARGAGLEMMKEAGRGVEGVRDLVTSVGGMVAATGGDAKAREKEGFLTHKAELEKEGTTEERKDVYVQLAQTKDQMLQGVELLGEQKKEDEERRIRFHGQAPLPMLPGMKYAVRSSPTL